MELSCLQNNLFTQYTEYSKQILPHEKSYAQLYYNRLYARFKTTWHMKELLSSFSFEWSCKRNIHGQLRGRTTYPHKLPLKSKPHHVDTSIIQTTLYSLCPRDFYNIVNYMI